MYWYLATPYTKFPGGIDAAFDLALLEAGRLMRAGVPVFSPIAHTHPIAKACGMDPLDHTIWLPVDRPMMQQAFGLIMLRAETWQDSYGMEMERQYFRSAGKPVFYMDPGTVPVSLRSGRLTPELYCPASQVRHVA